MFVKKREKNGVSGGKFVISLDFELFWGVHDVFSQVDYAGNIYGAHQAVREILELFKRYDIKATWAVVGMLAFETMEAFDNHLPKIKPNYAEEKRSSYYHASREPISKNEHDLYFAPGLIRAISETAGQEIGSHTFSHYYCLEKGQTLDAFIADAHAFMDVMCHREDRVQSIVFPRNQVNQAYLSTCRDLGFLAYRGNEQGWVYRIKQNDRKHILKRALRLLDMYMNLFGHQTYAIPAVDEGMPVNIQGSRQLKPVPASKWLRLLEGRRLHRILRAMTHAAQQGEIYHLWWHPHNFGVRPRENLAFLTRILQHYQELKQTYHFHSITMGALASDIINKQTIKENGVMV